MQIRTLLIATAAAGLIAGCSDYYGPGYYGPGYGPGYAGPGYGPGYAPGYYGGPVADIEYDGYYDGYYGPIYDGYWNGGFFYYRDREGGQWRRDNDRHFRREQAEGFNHVHGMTHSAPRRDRRPE